MQVTLSAFTQPLLPSIALPGFCFLNPNSIIVLCLLVFCVSRDDSFVYLSNEIEVYNNNLKLNKKDCNVNECSGAESFCCSCAFSNITIV